MDSWITVYWVVLLRLGQLLVAVAVAFIVLGLAGVVALVLGGEKERKRARRAYRFRLRAVGEGGRDLLAAREYRTAPFG